MNKTLLIFLNIFFILCFVSCSNQNNNANKVTELQNRIAALQSSTQKSADDAKKIADLESQVATLELPTNSSVTLSCSCHFDREETETGWTERHLQEKVEGSGNNRDEARKFAEDACKQQINTESPGSIYHRIDNCEVNINFDE